MHLKKVYLFGLTFFLALILTACGQRQTTVKQVSPRYQTTPTLFLHGYGGSAASTDNLINSAVSAGAATKVLKATVADNGQVKLSGTWSRNVKQPLIQIVFANSQSRDRQAGGTWIKNVLTSLQQRYGIRNFNFVAHSKGNTDLMNYEIRYGQQKHRPQLRKMVNIAAPMNGILGMGEKANQVKLAKTGKPSVMNANYRHFLKNIQNFPKNQVTVLNIFGNVDDGSNSDTRVSNASARSLKYLISGRATNYRELMVHGKKAQHSALTRSNPQVTKAINQFLFGVNRAR